MTERDELETRLRGEWLALLSEESTRSDADPMELSPHARLPMRRPALFAELEDVRTEWLRLRDPLVRFQDRYVNAGWTLKELVAHLASWAREFRHEVDVVARGERFDYAIPFALSVLGPNAWNAEKVAERASQDLEELLDEIDRETKRLQDLVFEIPDELLYSPASFPHAPTGDPSELWRGPTAVVILGRCQHDRHHLRQIRARLAAFAG